MAAPMHKITFQYKKVMFTLALEESIVTKLKTDADYIKELITFLIEQGTLKDKGVPTDADLADIKVVDEGVIPMFIPEEPTVTVNTSSSNTSQANLDKGLNGEKVLWTDAMTQLVIAARLEKHTDFEKPVRKRKLWDSIADVMRVNGYQVTADDCDTKWRNVLSTYKKNKEKAVAFGEEAVNWRFYFMMKNVLGDKVNASPKRAKSMPSPPDYDSESEEYASSPTSESFSRGRANRQPVKRCVCNSSSHPSRSALSSVSKHDTMVKIKKEPDASFKVKRRRCGKVRFATSVKTEASDESEAPSWFLKYLKDKKVMDQTREEKQETRWREYAALEEKKMEAMHALINALKPQ